MLLLNILHIFFPHFSPNYFIGGKLPLEKNDLEVFVLFDLPGWCFHLSVSGVLYQCQRELEGSPSARNRQENLKNMGGNVSVIWSSSIRIFKMLSSEHFLLPALCCGSRNSHRTKLGFSHPWGRFHPVVHNATSQTIPDTQRGFWVAFLNFRANFS